MRSPPALGAWIGPALLAIALLVAITSCPALSGAGRGHPTVPARSPALGGRRADRPAIANRASPAARGAARGPL